MRQVARIVRVAADLAVAGGAAPRGCRTAQGAPPETFTTESQLLRGIQPETKQKQSELD